MPTPYEQEDFVPAEAMFYMSFRKRLIWPRFLPRAFPTKSRLPINLDSKLSTIMYPRGSSLKVFFTSLRQDLLYRFLMAGRGLHSSLLTGCSMTLIG